MRTIKFRTWIKKWKEMREVYTIKWEDDGVFVEADQYCSFFKIDEIELMQSTGFLDLNGREIFEGDIIKYVNELYKVEFFNGGFFLRGSTEYEGDSDLIYGIHFSDMADLEKHCEIVGNIFENQEMIK